MLTHSDAIGRYLKNIFAEGESQKVVISKMKIATPHGIFITPERLQIKSQELKGKIPSEKIRGRGVKGGT